MAPSGSEAGNTSKPRIPASLCWCFTAYNTTPEEMKQMIGSNGSYVFGIEKCPTTGREHLQGYIKFKTKTRPLEKFKTENIHWEKARGDKESNIKYCTKDGDYHTNMRIPKILKESELFDWQKKIIDIIKEEPDDRTIHWIWEKEGCRGKTTFCKYLSMKYNAIPLEGKKNDILYCAAEFESDLYVWDLERSMEDYVSYSALEKIKNGFYMCAKYESKPIIRASPHVIVFANFEPDREKLSKDRWKVVQI